MVHVSAPLRLGMPGPVYTHVHDRELGEDLVQALLERSLRELDLAHVCKSKLARCSVSLREMSVDVQKARIRLIL